MSSPTLSEIEAMPALLTVEQAAAILQIPVSTVYDLGARGKIPRVKLGKAVRIPKARLLEATQLTQAIDSVVKDQDSWPKRTASKRRLLRQRR